MVSHLHADILTWHLLILVTLLVWISFYLKIDGASFLMIHGIKDVVRVAAQVGWGIE